MVFIQMEWNGSDFVWLEGIIEERELRITQINEENKHLETFHWLLIFMFKFYNSELATNRCQKGPNYTPLLQQQ